MTNRQENIHKLQTEAFDLCIIGGGASGAGCALDAALRGLKVALIDKSDFGGQTSSKSTKMVHGGVRYLEQAFKNLDFSQLRQVRHGLRERRSVLRNAPHLAHPLPLITPVFHWWSGLYYFIGLTLYEWFAARQDNLPKSRWISKQEALELFPGLTQRIHSAILYYDGQLDDARYNLALALSAQEKGAVIGNYLSVSGFHFDQEGRISAAIVEDQCEENQSYCIKARYFLNCCGPYADQIRLMANPESTPRIRPSKGVHMVLDADALPGHCAILIPKTQDGRMAFVIPFEQKMLVGTTDEPYEEAADEPVLLQREVDFLMSVLSPFLTKEVPSKAIKSGFGGLRPLVRSHHATGPATKSLLRDHEVEYDPKTGLLSLLGGKWTTYRLMAQDAIDVVCNHLGLKQPCTSEDYRLWGAMGWHPGYWKKIQEEFQIDEDIAQHLSQKYGDKAADVLEVTKHHQTLLTRLAPPYPFILAEVWYAVRFEMAVSPRDFLARRIRLELMDWETCKRCIPIVTKLMGEQLNWSESTQQTHIQSYTALIDQFISNLKT